MQLTQSSAILRYLGRKYGLVGETEQEIIRIDLIEQQMHDIRWSLFQIILNPDWKKVNDFVKSLPEQLEPVSAFLGDNDWFAGKKLTYVDFYVYESLEWFLHFSP